MIILYSISLLFILLLGFMALVIWGIYQFDKIFLNQLFFNYLNNKYSLPREWSKIGSIQQNIYSLLPTLEHLKVKEQVKLSDSGEYLIIQLGSNISSGQQGEIENIVKGIIANHEVSYTIDYSQVELVNGGWFILLKLETIEDATFNQNARATEPKIQEEFDLDEIIEL